MKKIICFLILIPSFYSVATAQETMNFEMRKKNATYVEFFGNSASFYSFNYDRIIKQYKMGYFNTSIGFSPVRYYGKGFHIPVSINYSYGEKNGHLEAGFGLGLTRNIQEEEIFSYLRLLANIRLGYKYQKASGGFFFKAAFTPIVPIYYFQGGLPKGSLADLELIVFNPFSICLGFSF